MSTADLYRQLASSEARGDSRCYQEWAEGVAADLELIGLIDELPEPRAQDGRVPADRPQIQQASPGDGTRHATRRSRDRLALRR